jgi:Transposase IS116/IS110/IS902 family
MQGFCGGLVPKQMSTGDRTILGRISKRGNHYLRMLFMQGEAAHQGEIPTIGIGRRYLVPMAALDRMLSRGSVSEPSAIADADGAA